MNVADAGSQFRELLTKHTICIIQQFRSQNADFDLHINTCRGEYKMLLRYLLDLEDDVTKGECLSFHAR